MIVKVLRPIVLAIVAAGASRIAPAQGLASESPSSICRMALDVTASEWDFDLRVAPYVEEARRRGYSLGYCRTVGLAGQAASASPARRAATDPTLVRSIQGHLATLGFLAGAPDGILGPMTSAAIRAFQRVDQADADGQPSEALNDRLQAVSALQAGLEIDGLAGCTRADDGRAVCVNMATGNYRFVSNAFLDRYRQALQEKMAVSRPPAPPITQLVVPPPQPQPILQPPPPRATPPAATQPSQTPPPALPPAAIPPPRAPLPSPRPPAVPRVPPPPPMVLPPVVETEPTLPTPTAPTTTAPPLLRATPTPRTAPPSMTLPAADDVPPAPSPRAPLQK